jgi:hypothetical protein
MAAVCAGSSFLELHVGFLTGRFVPAAYRIVAVVGAPDILGDVVDVVVVQRHHAWRGSPG